MRSVSPTMEGFRAAFRRPSVTFGEIIWRWSVGATATALFFFGLFEYLNTLPVTSGEMLLLKTRQPYLIGQAIAHILHGSLNRAVMSLTVAAVLMGVLWIIAASLGRIATVEALISYFRDKFIVGPKPEGIGKDVASDVPASAFPALVRLNFLRAVVSLAAIVGVFGAGILAGFASPTKNPQPELVFVLFLPVAALVCLAWWFLNWLLSLAGLLAVRDCGSAIDAIADAIGLCRERTGAVFAVSSWSGLAHLVVFVAASTAVSLPLSFAGILPGRLVLAAMIVVTLVYLAVADWLYVARMAGYVCLLELPEAFFAPTPPAPVPATPLQTMIDRDEPILSDLPGLIAET